MDLRSRLEAARLDLLALFRALDQMELSPAEIPQRLMRQLFEMDADYAEALLALDKPPGSLDRQTRLRDTPAALDQPPETRARFRRSPATGDSAAGPEISVRSALDPPKPITWSPVIDSPKVLRTPSKYLRFLTGNKV